MCEHSKRTIPHVMTQMLNKDINKFWILEEHNCGRTRYSCPDPRGNHHNHHLHRKIPSAGIKDIESPEYELFLIGQCDKSANTFIKYIEKILTTFSGFHQTVFSFLTAYSLHQLFPQFTAHNNFFHSHSLTKQTHSQKNHVI